MNEKTRYLVSFDDAKKLFIKLTLYDEKFIIKTRIDEETVSLDPIISLGSYHKQDIAAFARHLSTKKKELLYEIDPNEIGQVDFDIITIRTFHILKNGKYYEEIPEFKPRFVRLLEFDLIQTLYKQSYDVVVVTTSQIDKDSLFLSENSILVIGDSYSKRHEVISDSHLGCDYYLLPHSSELLEKFPNYEVELEEVEKNVFKMRKRNYYFIRLLTVEELNSLNPRELKLYKDITKKNSILIMDIDNNEILEFKDQESMDIDNDLNQVNKQELYRINYPILDELLKEEYPTLKECIYIFQQQEMQLKPITLDEILNKQRKKTL
ncbi:MAG: hypothetical protein GX265_04800 [Mollicutes bacterium]|nr:hypothetical protein [Mollicutes bacterium]